MSARDHERREQKAALRLQFVVVFVVAAAGGIAFVLWRIPWLPAVWASLVMIAYGLLAYSRAPELAQTDEFGDSFYYLGFTLTLVALVAVLVSLGGGDPSETIEAVLPQFGFALLTTLVGLLGRTVFTMFRPEREPTEERAEKELSDAFDDFTQALQRLTAEADAFQQRFSAELESSVMSLRGTVDQFHEIVEKSADDAQPLVAAVVETTANLREGSATLDEALKTFSERAERSGQTLESRVDSIAGALSRSANSAEEALAHVEGQAGSLADAIDETERSMRGLSGLHEEFGRLSDSMGAVNESLEHFETGSVDELRTLRREIREAAGTAEDVKKTIKTFSQDVRVQHKDLGGALEDWTETLDKITRLQAELQDESNEAARVLMQVRRELAAGVQFLRKSMESALPMEAGGDSDG